MYFFWKQDHVGWGSAVIPFSKENTAIQVSGRGRIYPHSRVHAKRRKGEKDVYEKGTCKSVLTEEHEAALFFLIAVDLHADRLAPVGFHSLGFRVTQRLASDVVGDGFQQETVLPQQGGVGDFRYGKFAGIAVEFIYIRAIAALGLEVTS